ncbi:CDP-glycerol glycerophosphotransferase family protein [Isoptericola sp. S6320L]|uniref:CDP-glycerol glycerophosphotransferase family protein n=1 Tax=Isoptericola sp. S6320L TaxID=2926411 RepID=UPI001FF5D4BC|nr:CDP-glycerol glycerophosphotransferase family protein [Isoptericola sp. S6320L]MCK0118293.1 CDP-glycerol glycerophosphotransferase family protein [Isoptericola sp. S6320L]
MDELDAESLSGALEAVRMAPGLREVPMTIVHQPGVDVGPVLEQTTDVRAAVALPEVELAVMERLLGATTKYACVAVLPRPSKVPAWTRKVVREVNRLEQLPLASDVPLLVWAGSCTRQTVAQYVNHMLARQEVEPGSLLAAYLGRLTLAAANPLLEAVDPQDGDLEVLAFFAAQFVPGMPEPPWRFRIVLTGPSGDVVRSEPIRLTPRIDSHGKVRWEELTTTLSLRTAGNGHSRFIIEVDTEEPLLRLRRNLRPRRGALISARTVHMPVPAAQGSNSGAPVTVRYLLHTTGDGSAAFITSQIGTGWRAKVRWAATLLKKDAGFIFRGRKRRQMRWLRLVRLVTRPFFARRKIWLIGERTDTAQDNGVHLFAHMREVHPERAVYYVIDRSSPQYDRVAKYGNVIAHSSWQHQLLMLHAAVLANAYSIRYLIPASWGAGSYTRHLVWRVGALRVYLKHGVHLSPNSVKRGTTGYDLCLTVMPGETAALRASSGYDEQLVEVGMPRYDALTPTPPSRTLLFMPTWRKYLVTKVLDGAEEGEEPYEGSAYERFMTGFLESRRLHDLLEKYDYRLTFLPHYNMASRFEGASVAGERIQLANADDVTFQDLIRGCDAFITDFSSVHFDVAYVGTPIVYARFDEEDFETKHSSPSWFDYEADGFGPVVRSLDQTLDAVEDLLERGCEPDPFYAARVDAAFASRDQQNCARTVAAIDSHVAQR